MSGTNESMELPLLRREFTVLTTSKREARRLENTFSSWANDECRVIKRLKKSEVINPSQKFSQRLPFSGGRIKVKGDDGHWEVSVNTDVNLSNFEFEGFPTESHCIELYRNNVDHLNGFRDIEFALYMKSLNLVHLFGNSLIVGKIFEVDGKEYIARIQKSFFGLMLASESLHLTLMLKNLREFIIDQYEGLKRLISPLTHSAGKSESSANNQFGIISKALAGFIQFTSPLDHVEADWALEQKHGLEMEEVHKYLIQLLEVYDRNQLGSNLLKFSTDDEMFDMFSEFSFEPLDMNKGGPEYDILNRTLSTNAILTFCIRLRRTSFGLDNTRSSVFVEIPTLEESLRSELREHYLDDFRIVVDKYNHIIDGIPPNAKEAVMDDVSDISMKISFLEAEKILDSEYFVKLLEILTNPPSQWGSRLDLYRHEYNLDSTWNDRILKFEKFLGISNLAKGVKGQFGLGEIEQKLRAVIERSEKADRDYRRQINILQNQSKVDKLSSGGDPVEELTTAKLSLKRKAQEYSRDIEKAEPADVGAALDKFGKEMWLELEHFADIMESSDTSFVPSEGVGALLIGLGQGGQQILRATMANLLNTTSDSRSRNMLHGLGFNGSDIQKIQSVRRQDRDFSNPSERNREAMENLFGKKANLLALNLGPELEQLLKQPYSFIWGKAGDNAYKQYNNELIRRPSPNLLLLDPDSQGAGGRMGKGRAYAFTSRDYIREALELYKGRGRNITQIAVIHSFAGGSGSGMILPLLGECKLSFPDADIWVLSAGDEKNAAGAYTPHNVSYITSEVLQSHYNALHHRAEKLTSNDWKSFSNGGRKLIKELYDLWDKISNCLERDDQLSNRINRYKDRYDQSLHDLNQVGGTAFKSMTGDKDSNIDVFEILPASHTHASSYHDGLVGINSDEYFAVWKTWLRSASDPANLWAENKKVVEGESADSDGVRSGLRYKLSYGNLRTLANLLKKRDQFDDDDEFREILAEEQYQAVIPGIKDASLKAMLNRQDENNTLSSYEDLGDLISQYAIKMQDYHARIYSFSERILMNRGVLDDTLIKHVIISNAHLDMAVNFYKGNEPTYEIYNSTMAEVFVNIVHAMVSDAEGSLSESGGTHEVMDVSDMRRRTKPPMIAVVMDPISTQDLSSVVQYKDTHFTALTTETSSPFTVFENFFTRSNSPLYTSDEMRTIEAGGESLKALFTVYFGGSNSSMFKIHPRDVIDSYRQTASDPVWQAYANDAQDASEFYSMLESEGLNSEELESSFSFGLADAVNMLHWIRLIPVRLIAGFLRPEGSSETLREFLNLTNRWSAAQNEILNYSGANSPLNSKTRKAEFSNMIGDVFGLEVKGEHRQELATLLFELGLLDTSHLSAVQSAYLFEPAPYLLTPEELEFNGQKVTKDMMYEYLATPTAFYRAGATEYTKLENKNYNRIAIPQLLANEKNFSSASLLTMWEDGRDGPKLLHLKTKAVEWLSRLKISASEKSPEFCSLSLFDTLISSSSNPVNNSLVREPSESPSFRQSRAVFDRMALIRPLYSAEPLSLTMFRIAILGKTSGQSNHQESALRNSYLGSMAASEWIDAVQSLHSYDFGTNFSPEKFADILLQRIVKFAEVSITSNEPLNIHQIILHLLQNRLREILLPDEESEGVQRNIRHILDSLNNDLVNNSISEILSELEYVADHNVVNKAGREIANFVSKLSTALFESIRQHSFLNQQMRAGEGVAFGLTGSTDAYRSKPDEFLTVINTSSGVETSAIIQTIRDFFRLYIRPREGEHGKTFIQHIEGGPLASITVLMQKTGSIEIADNVKKVYGDLSARQLSTATKTLVHPYSFLRNILWLTTFHGQWLNEPTAGYLDSFKVPSDVSRKVFGNPALIEQAIESVRQSGDMTTHAMPDDDVNRWNSVAEIWSDDIIIRNQRMRGVIHIPDMLAINYLRTKYPETFTDYLTKNEVDEELEKIYPSRVWFDFFKKKGINEQSVGVFVAPEENMVVEDNPFAPANPFASAGAAVESGHATADDWYYALSKWNDKFKDVKKVARVPKEAEPQTVSITPTVEIREEDIPSTAEQPVAAPHDQSSAPELAEPETKSVEHSPSTPLPPPVNEPQETPAEEYPDPLATSLPTDSIPEPDSPDEEDEDPYGVLWD